MKARIGFYVELPKATVAEIRRAAKASGIPHWKVVSLAVGHLPGMYFVKITTPRTGGPVKYSDPGKRGEDRFTGPSVSYSFKELGVRMTKGGRIVSTGGLGRKAKGRR